jgi:hypothetical protein
VRFTGCLGTIAGEPDAGANAHGGGTANNPVAAAQPDVDTTYFLLSISDGDFAESG